MDYVDIVKGLFTGDASTFFESVKNLFVDFPTKIKDKVSDAFFGLLENAFVKTVLNQKWLKDIKMFFRQLPEKIIVNYLQTLISLL